MISFLVVERLEDQTGPAEKRSSCERESQSHCTIRSTHHHHLHATSLSGGKRNNNGKRFTNKKSAFLHYSMCHHLCTPTVQPLFFYIRFVPCLVSLLVSTVISHHHKSLTLPMPYRDCTRCIITHVLYTPAVCLALLSLPTPIGSTIGSTLA